MSLTPLSIGVVAAAALSAAWVGWGFLYPPSLTLHYKQTVILDGPEGTVEMSGVFKEVARYSAPVPGVAAHIGSYRIGEALGSEVPGIGYVVQSLARRGEGLSGTVVSTACEVAPPDLHSAAEASLWFQAVDRAFGSRCELPLLASQVVVVFADTSRPALGKAYLPDHLPSGLSIRSIVLQPTTDPVTYGRLPASLWTFSPGTPVPTLPLVPDTGAVFTLVETKFRQVQ